MKLTPILEGPRAPFSLAEDAIRGALFVAPDAGILSPLSPETVRVEYPVLWRTLAAFFACTLAAIRARQEGDIQAALALETTAENRRELALQIAEGGLDIGEEEIPREGIRFLTAVMDHAQTELSFGLTPWADFWLDPWEWADGAYYLREGEAPAGPVAPPAGPGGPV